MSRQVTSATPGADVPHYYYPDHGGAGVKVYVLDTGINYKHEEFGANRVEAGWSAFGDDLDRNGHGTHVASVIGGKMTGVAKVRAKEQYRMFACAFLGPNTSWKHPRSLVNNIRLSPIPTPNFSERHPRQRPHLRRRGPLRRLGLPQRARLRP